MTTSARVPAQLGLSPEQVELIDARRRRRVDRREITAEAAVAAGFLAAAGAFWLAAGSPPLGGALALYLALLCAVLVRIEFQVGDGHTRPVVLALVPMLFVLEPAAVPLVFAAAHVAARLPDVAARRMPPRRLVMMLGDAWFALPPALAVAATGTHPALVVLALALTAQMGGDFVLSSLRFWASVGVGPRAQLRGYAWVYLVDLLLAPVALLAALAAREEPFAVFAMLPLAALIAVFADERKGRVENALALQRTTDRLQAIVQHSSDLIVVLEPDGALRTLNGSFAAIFGVEPAQHGSLLDRVHADDAARVTSFLAAVAERPVGESAEDGWRMRYDDGSYRHIEAVATNLLGDGVVNGLVLTARDVEARKLFEEQLRHRAFHDELTGLANRALFFDRVEHALMRGTREDGQVAVVFVDLDDFKAINDRLGHAAGDRVLREVADRFSSSARSADTVARLGGDEFGVLLEGVAGGRAMQAAERLLETLRAPLELDGEQIRISASAGIALGAADSRDVEDLLRKGDLAMYEAKRNGKRRLERFSPEMARADAPGRRPLTWFMRSDEQHDEIRSLLDDPQSLTMAFQPIMDLRTGRIAGYEALARFNRTPYRSPDQWFAQAHRCGLGYAVEAKALSAALAMRGRPDGTYLAVNLSPSSLTAAEIQAVLPECLDDLVIEVTENELASGDPAVADAIAALRGRGARLAVDDVGAGYAGLTHVMRLAPDVIKLDRALTTGIEGDAVKAALVSSFVRYARDIAATVCGEGIETVAELTALAGLDVAYGQGYLIARPAAPWAPLDPAAADACTISFQAAFGDADVDGRLNRRIARAGSLTELAEELPQLARMLDADEVRILAREPAAAGQLLAGDPGADPEAVAELLGAGYRAVLTLPIGETGSLRAYNRVERPWTRFHIGRARMLTTLMERLS